MLSKFIRIECDQFMEHFLPLPDVDPPSFEGLFDRMNPEAQDQGDYQTQEQTFLKKSRLELDLYEPFVCHRL